MLILNGVLWGWANSTAPPSGMSERVDTTAAYMADQSIATAGATGNKTATIAASDDWITIMVALTPEPTTGSGGEVAFRSVASVNPDGRVNTTINKPSGVADGDILIAGIAVAGATHTAPSGWTLITSKVHSSQPVTLYVYWKRAGSSEPTSYTWTHDEAGTSGYIAAYSGAKATGSPLDVTATTNDGSGTSFVGTGVTTQTNNAMLLFNGVLWGWANNSTPPSGMSERVDTTGVYFADQLIGTAGSTGNKTATIAVSDDWVTIVTALKPEPVTSSSATTYTYDANGNMTSDGITCYQINEANQLDKVTNCSGQTIAEYVYDYNGNRMVKRNFTNGTLANTVTSWSDSFETKVIEGGGTENTSYYFVNGQLIAKKDNSGTRTFFHNDHLGSTSLVTNQSGTAVETTTYDPWGKINVGGTASKFLYTGQEHDGETGLHYYNARYYDSHIRRFTQPDDIIQDVYNPQSLNRYSYVLNNPLRYTDPTGHAIWGTIFNAVKSFFRPVVTSIAKAAPSIPIIGPMIQKATNNQQVVQKAQPVMEKAKSNPVVQYAAKNFDNQTKMANDGIKTLASVGNAARVHGNSLKSTAQTWGYTLRDVATGAIKKVGETMHPETRYSDTWLKKNNLELKPEAFGTKADMRIWEHEQIGEYIFKYGEAPMLNNINRAVNVFR